jgi:hypothetical protein
MKYSTSCRHARYAVENAFARLAAPMDRQDPQPQPQRSGVRDHAALLVGERYVLDVEQRSRAVSLEVQVHWCLPTGCIARVGREVALFRAGGSVEVAAGHSGGIWIRSAPPAASTPEPRAAIEAAFALFSPSRAGKEFPLAQSFPNQEVARCRLRRYAGSVCRHRSRPAAAAPLAAAEAVDHATISRIRDEGLRHSQVMATLEHLTDRVGPRLTGSAALHEANNGRASGLPTGGCATPALEGYDFGRGWHFTKSAAHAHAARRGALRAAQGVDAGDWRPGARRRRSTPSSIPKRTWRPTRASWRTR